MTAKSMSRGHVIHWDDEKQVWIDPISGEHENDRWKCKQCKKDPVRVDVLVKKDQAQIDNEIQEACKADYPVVVHDYYEKECYIDSCIAPIIKALSDGGIETKRCCCGHKKGGGVIALVNGMELMITTAEEKARLDEIFSDNKDK